MTCRSEASTVRLKLRIEMNYEIDAANRKPSGTCCTPSADRQLNRSCAAKTSFSARQLSVETRSRMVLLPGGTFLMGTDFAGGFPADGEGPVRPVTLRPFSIDRYPVTNWIFSQFVEATGYRTDAERYGWSFVFWLHIPRSKFSEMVEDRVQTAPWWCKVRGAMWSAPEGPGSDISTRENHPVVHVSWNDAVAFTQWSGQRLPTEAEWEYAARGGLEQKLYPWGDKLRPNGEHRCNIWQGEFPNRDTGEDGYTGTCPVDAFSPRMHSGSSCGKWSCPEYSKYELRHDNDCNRIYGKGTILP